MKIRAGIYCWAGPGTERMIKLKYPQQKIDKHSLSRSYDYDQLAKAQENLGITDAWVSYSWGFSPETEKIDYEFITRKIKNFQKLGIRTHGYIQGLNLVYADHQDRDYWARDYWNRLIPYHRGRKLACPNNPYFQEYLLKKIDIALKLPFDGIFIDNLFMGQFPLVFAHRQVSFFGCGCEYCRALFWKEYGFDIPKLYGLHTDDLLAYQAFRVQSLMSFTKTLADIVHSAGKLFGSNSFDPKYDTKLLYGYDLNQLIQLQDYLLFENHDLPRPGKNNLHIGQVVASTKKPVMVVSYKQGIGREPLYRQTDYDAIFTESQKVGYIPAYKASEFTDQGVGKNMDFTKIKPVSLIKDLNLESIIHPPYKSLKFKPLARMYNRWYLNFMEKYYESDVMRKSFNWVYYRGIQ